MTLFKLLDALLMPIVAELEESDLNTLFQTCRRLNSLPLNRHPITNNPMTLLKLPNELLLINIVAELWERDLNSLIRTNRRLYHLLLDKLYDKNIKFRESVGLFHAIHSGQVRAVAKFIELGANVNVTKVDLIVKRRSQWDPTDYGYLKATSLLGEARTPLYGAIICRHDEIVSQLLEAGADPNSGMSGTEVDSPLNQAIARKDVKLTRLLLAYGAHVPNNAPSPWGAYRGGDPPLFVAICRGVPEMVKLLLHHGASVGGRDSDLCTPLFAALMRIPMNQTPASADQQLAIIMLLLEKGASTDADRGGGRTQREIAAGHADWRVRRLFQLERKLGREKALEIVRNIGFDAEVPGVSSTSEVDDLYGSITHWKIEEVD